MLVKEKAKHTKRIIKLEQERRAELTKQWKAMADNRDKQIITRVVYQKTTTEEYLGEPEENDEVREIMDRFMAPSSNHGFIAPWKVVKIVRVHNPYLEERYASKRREFEAARLKRNESDILMFHGTAQRNIQPYIQEGYSDNRIFRDGFAIGGVNDHPVHHGSSWVYTSLE